MRQMKRRLIMLLLVLALMILHITAVVPAQEPSIKTETEETKSEEKKSDEVKEEAEDRKSADETKPEEKKADEKKAVENIEEAVEGETPSEETKTDEKKADEKKAVENIEEAAESQIPSEETEPEEKKTQEVKEEAAEGQTPAEETKAEEEKAQEVKEEAAEGGAPAEGAKAAEKNAERAKEKAAEGQTVTTPAVNAAKDVWIDNTVDNSTSIIYSVIKEHDESTGEEGHTYSFKEQIPVTFSNPRPQAVEDAINEVTEELKETAKERGYKVYSIYEDTPTVKVWDNRKYETIEDNDAVLIGDTGYYSGTPAGDITRTHVASGDYGKNTSYYVILDVTLNHTYSITVKTSGKGTVTAEPESAAEGTSVSVKYKADRGYRLADALVRNDSVGGPDGQISAVVYGESGMTEDSISFKMPASDVTVYVGFEEIPHDHDLVKTEEVKATCETDGTQAYWTCSICGRMFSDEKGSTEIEKPVKIPASGHSWGDWVVTKEPTEQEAGEKTRTCKVDPNHKETVSIPALEKEEEPEPAVEEDKDDKDDKNNEVTAPQDNKKNNSTSAKKTSSKHSKKSSKKSSSKAKSPKTGDRTDAYFRAFMTMALFLGMICAVLAGRNKNRRG